MSKQIQITVQLYWVTTIDVEDDFNLDTQTARDLVQSEKPAFDFQDGGLWAETATCVELDEEGSALEDDVEVPY